MINCYLIPNETSMQMVLIPSPAEGDFGGVRMEPLGSPRRDAHPGLILEPEETL